MPVFQKKELETFVADVFGAVGFPAGEARLVAELMVRANLSGHDSHGVRQVPRYLARVEKGEIVPGAPITVEREGPTTAVLDAHRALGHVAAAKAVELVVAKARQAQVAMVAVRNLDHVGRLGGYPERVAAEGLVCLAFVGAQGPGRSVAPFGGVAGRLGTNPFGAAFPVPGGEPILLDFATSVVAANKVRQAQDREVETGAGWIMDAEGGPTRDPRAYTERGGMLNPLGDGRGHKGYGLAVMVEIMGAVLSGAGAAHTAQPITNNATTLIAIDPEPFVGREAYARQLAELCDYLRATPVAPGAPPVQLPGEYEAAHRRAREAEGIPIEPAVWKNIAAAAERVRVPAPVPPPAAPAP